MTSIKIFLSTLLLFSVATGFAQTNTTWNNKQCAVVLTYDDALQVGLDNAIPVLDSLQLKATFYLSGNFQGFKDNIARWKTAAQHGHELANHSLFHPCVGNTPGREWVPQDYKLENYTIRRMADELRMTNTLLETLDGKKRRTFAYPCGDTKIRDSLYLDKRDFVAARGVKAEMLPIDKIDLYNIGCYTINGQTGDQLIDLVKKAMQSNTLLVFLFHGVGGGHDLNVSLDAHSKLLHFLKAHEKEIWIAPCIEVADYIRQYQAKK